MKYHIDNLSLLFTTAMTGVTAWVGGWDTAFRVFITCIILDLATGVLKGWVTKEFSSKRMRTGFATKFGYVIVVVLATQLDQLMPEDAPILRTVAVWFYIYVEGFSILENLAQMGVPVPNAIIERLAVFKDKGGKQVTLDKNGKIEEKE